MYTQDSKMPWKRRSQGTHNSCWVAPGGHVYTQPGGSHLPNGAGEGEGHAYIHHLEDLTTPGGAGAGMYIHNLKDLISRVAQGRGWGGWGGGACIYATRKISSGG